MSKDYTYKHTISEDNDAKFEIKVNADLFTKTKKNVYKKLAKDVSIKGFRIGKAPENLILAQLGSKLYEETINEILPEVTIEILNEEKINPLTQVEYVVNKVDEKEGVDFEVKFAVYPKFELPEFSKIKITKAKVQVEDKEVDQVFTQMFEDSNKEVQKDKESEIVPDDKWVESLKMKEIKTIKDLKDQIRKSLASQREVMNDEKYISDMLMEGCKLSKINAPKRLIDLEIGMREKDYTKRIEKLGLKVDDFLRSQKTTMEDLKKQWAEELKNTINVELLLTKIILDNKIEATEAEINAEINQIEDKKLKEEYSTKQSKQRIANIIMKQKAIQIARKQMEGEGK